MDIKEMFEKRARMTLEEHITEQIEKILDLESRIKNKDIDWEWLKRVALPASKRELECLKRRQQGCIGTPSNCANCIYGY
jgi:hypothetical protein